MIPTGRAFDTVRLSAALVHAAAGGTSPETVADAFGRMLTEGAVIHDAYGTGVWYYALVPVGTCTRWQAPDATCLLADGTWIGVPRLNRTTRPGPYWILPPQKPQDLCLPQAVTDLIRHGRQRLAQPCATPVPDSNRQPVREFCAQLVSPGVPTMDLATADDALTRTWGYLMTLLPEVEEAASKLPLDDPLRARATIGVAETRRQLDATTASSNLATTIERTQRLARCCLGRLNHLDELRDRTQPTR
ncbi:hypothetical protein GCM10010388_65490 [Streptomyces mauvecolor]